MDRSHPYGRYNDSRYNSRGNYSHRYNRRFSPEGRKYSPERRKYSPDGRNYSPEGRRYSPESRKYSPGSGRYSAEGRRYSQDVKQEDVKTEVKPSGVDLKPSGVDLKPSGLLAAETNTKNGVLVKFTLPLEARHPTQTWKLFVFKGQGDAEETKVLRLDRQKSFLIGKDLRVVDISMLHPTISKQHAAIVHRQKGNVIKPYIIDLESTNGTFLNDERIEPSRYYELKAKDILRFAKSSREYVVLPDSLADDVEIDLQDVIHQELEKEEAKKSSSMKAPSYW